MKKLLILLLLSSVALQASLPEDCKPCAFARQFPDRFHFIGAYQHGAPVEAVSTLCSCGTATNLVGIAGYLSNLNCPTGGVQSMRAYIINPVLGNRLEDVAIDNPIPSDYLYASDMCCINSTPTWMVAGCPDSSGNVLWTYTYSTEYGWTQQVSASWGATGVTPKPTLIYSVAIKCVECTTEQNPFYQVALVGKALEDKSVRIYLLKYYPLSQTFILQQTKILTDAVKDYYSVAWLTPPRSSTNPCQCNFSCSYLTVAGTAATGEDCQRGNIHTYLVTCDGVVSEVLSNANGIGMIKFPTGDNNEFERWSVRKVVWTTDCCRLYPYPFLLAIGDRTNPNGSVQSMAIVYYFNPTTGEFKELAESELWDGKLFAAAFTPGCACKAVTVAGGRCMDGYTTPCDPNIWTLKYDCPADGRYPVLMTRFADATHTSFDSTITSLAFCTELIRETLTCQVMIVTSEDPNWAVVGLDPLSCGLSTKGEIGVYKVAPCVTVFKPCVPEPICVRKSIKEVPCRKR